jgi:hypothetical protein
LELQEPQTEVVVAAEPVGILEQTAAMAAQA